MSFRQYEKSIIVNAILLMISGAVYAQEHVEELGEVNVVSATDDSLVRANNAQNAAITLIGVSTIDNSAAQNVTDVFRYTPGVHVERSTTAGVADIMIRGMGGAGSDDGTGQNRVAINIDGVPLNDAFAHGHITRNTRATFDTSDLKQVEVIKGPGLVGAGKSGLAGTVNYTTKDPEDYYMDEHRYGGNIRSGYDSQDRSKFIGGTIAADLSNSLSTMLSFTHRSMRELKNKGGLDVVGAERTYNNPTKARSQNYLGKFVYRSNDNNKFTLKLEHFNLRNRINVLDTRYAKLGDYEDDNYNTRTAFSLRHDFIADSALFDSGHWLVYTQKTEQTREQDLAYGIPSYAKTGFKVRNSGAQLSFNKQLTTGSIQHNLHYGFNYERTSTDVSWLWDASVFGMGVSKIQFQPKTVVNHYDVFVSDDIALLDDRWFITPGLRFGHYKISPKATEGYGSQAPFDRSSRSYTDLELGTRFNLNDNHQLFFSYRQGVRAQSFAEMNSAGFHSKSLPNPNLKPEKSRGVELGLRSHGRLGSQAITAFHTSYKDMIAKTFIGRYPNNASTMHNKSGKVVIYGLEYQGTLHLAQAFGTPDGWKLSAGLAYAKGRDRELNQPWASVDPLTGYLQLSYDDPSEKWGVASTLNFAKAKKAKDIDTKNLQSKSGYRPIAGYGTVDLTAYWHVNKHLQLNAGIYNLGDRQYVTWNDAQSAALVGNAYSRMTRPGRSFALNVKYQF